MSRHADAIFSAAHRHMASPLRLIELGAGTDKTGLLRYEPEPIFANFDGAALPKQYKTSHLLPYNAVLIQCAYFDWKDYVILTGMPNAGHDMD